MKNFLLNQYIVPLVLALQPIAILIFTLDVYRLSSQEFWLPALFLILLIIAITHLLGKKGEATWSLRLCNFIHGFNIISRLLMLMSHALKYNSTGKASLNWAYIALSLIGMLLSVFYIWYLDQPELRRRVSRLGLAGRQGFTT